MQPVHDTTDTVVRVLKAVRAARDIKQSDICREMRQLGFTNWHSQTVGKIERGERRITVDELTGLASILGQDPAAMLNGQIRL